MARLLTLIAGLAMVLSLGLASVVHASEPQGGFAITADTSSFVAAAHTQNDHDRVPSDSDKGYAHHHGGCHGDHQFAPAEKTGIVGDNGHAIASFGTLVVAMRAGVVDPNLRPPRA